MKFIIDFIKSRIVFFISLLCAVISMFFVPPSKAYIQYIDWNTLFILFSLMICVSGFENSGIFDKFCKIICSHITNLRLLSVVLIVFCFFSSMIITNDVALITFVPFTLLVLSNQNEVKLWHIIYIIVLETIAANTGSMLTPIGNPQNLFIFNKYNMNVSQFISILFPYSFASFCLLYIFSFIIPKITLNKNLLGNNNFDDEKMKFDNSLFFKRCFYFFLFLCCLFSVIKNLTKWPIALFVCIGSFIFDRKVILKVDYYLLFTFVFFFIFTGNLGEIHIIREFLESSVKSKEFFVGFGVSQIISNVPATLILYQFVDDIKNLLIGVNVGGLGTIVASLASLISFNIYNSQKSNGCLFLIFFTVLNVIFLLVLILLYTILN